MTWFRVDDSLPAHPKVEELEGDWQTHALAVAAWTLLGADSAARGTDGLVTLPRIAKVLQAWPERLRTKACEALVRVRLWEREGDAFRFHDWTHYQPTKEQREKERAATRERQRAWKEKRRVGNAVTDASGNADYDGVDNTAPSRPVPSREDLSDLDREGDLDQVARAPSPVFGLDAVDTPLARLRRAFERRWLAKRLPNGMGLGTHWPGFHKHADLAKELAEQFADDVPRLERSLDGYFASTDPFVATKAKWNFKGWANDPERFIGTRSEPSANAVEIMSRVPRITDHAERTGTQ